MATDGNVRLVVFTVICLFLINAHALILPEHTRVDIVIAVMGGGRFLARSLGFTERFLVGG